jgi:hypothetical protein
MKSNIFSTSLVSVMAFGLVACGGGSSGGGNRQPLTAVEQQTTPVTVDGTYFATVRTINNSLSGYLPTGQAQVKIEKGFFNVRTALEDSADVIHYQAIYSASTCPTEADDLNADGYVDVDEMTAKTGTVLVPVDSDLSDQTNGVYLKGKSIRYSKTIAVNTLMNSLMGDDTNSADYVTKLAPGQVFGVENKVIVFHGVSASKNLPASIATLPGQSAQASMPIACGVLRRL